MRWLRRALVVLGLVVAGLVVSAQPAFAACEGDAPFPAKPGPYKPAVVVNDGMPDGRPFGPEADSSIQTVYGTTPQVWNYDNGCSPGAGIMPSVGAGLANIGFDISGALSAWTHALLEAVIAPFWAEPLDKPVAAATTAVANGTWTPWLVLVLSLVAITVLFRSREGHLSGAITATAWALLVLITVSWVVSYPTESVQAVDGTVQSTVVQIGDGFTGETTTGDTKEEQALRSVDQQMGSVIETVQYRTWLEAVFGDADSATADKFGPGVFMATHFNWAEWEAYNEDPDGVGAAIRADKADQFKALAEALKEEDPAAYEHFTGSQWGNRITSGGLSVLVMAMVCLFLLVAGLTVLAAFAVIRLLVPFTPALGVIFLLDIARERAIDVFRKVGGVLVMGPAYFVASLVLLRFYGELLTADIPFLLRLTFVLALSVIAWRLLKPSSSLTRVRVPGVAAARRYAGTRRPGGSGSGGSASPVEVGREHGPEQGHVQQRPVFNGDGVSQPAAAYQPTTPGTFVERRQPEVVVWNRSDRQDPDEERTGRREPRRATVAVVPKDRRQPVPAGTGMRAGGVVADADRYDANVPAPYAYPGVARTVEPHGSSRVNEANLTLDEDGNRVFVVYAPDGAAR